MEAMSFELLVMCEACMGHLAVHEQGASKSHTRTCITKKLPSMHRASVKKIRSIWYLLRISCMHVDAFYQLLQKKMIKGTRRKLNTRLAR